MPAAHSDGQEKALRSDLKQENRDHRVRSGKHAENWAASRGHWLHRDEMQKAVQSDDRPMIVNIRPRIERAIVEAIFLELL
jgi:hypothetical protein